MEEDKKKKKNKKKKNKQTTVRINDTSADGSTGGDFVPPGKNHTTNTTQVDAVSITHQDGHINLPKEGTQTVIQEDNIREVPSDKDLSFQKEVMLAGLQEQLEELRKEKAAHIQQEASLHEQILQFVEERDAYMKKEAGLEQKIAELQVEKEFLMRNEGLLEVIIGQLQMDKESWFHKEALFEEKINHLMDEAATLSLEKVSLDEKVKQMENEQNSWILQENLTREVIAGLNGDNSSLKSQVGELEELRNSLLQENHLLKKTISGLQSQILNLERSAVSSSASTEIKMHPPENGDVEPETDAAHQLVEKLICENSELVEKVGAAAAAAAAAYDVIDEVSEKMKGSDLRVQTLEEHDAKNAEGSNEYSDANNTVVFTDPSKIIESDEIVQIPLDENEREPPTDLLVPGDAEKAEVPLMDAPLIGAPFRLISFVARYVSGADLVEKNSVKSGA